MWENWMFLENEYRNVLEIISGNFCWNEFGRILKKNSRKYFWKNNENLFFYGKHFQIELKMIF